MKVFDVANTNNYTSNLLAQYQDSLKDYRDLKNTLETYASEGKAESRAEVAINAMKKGLDDNLIHDITGLSLTEIVQIRHEHDL